MDSLAQGAERRFNGFVTRTTKRITVHGAKLAEKFLRIALCPVYWDRTGRAPSRNSKPSSAANPRAFSVCMDGTGGLPLGSTVVPLRPWACSSLPMRSLPVSLSSPVIVPSAHSVPTFVSSFGPSLVRCVTLTALGTRAPFRLFGTCPDDPTQSPLQLK